MSMEPFTTVRGKAVPMPEENIDTDIIFPARFLLITAREGLGRYAFNDRRYDASGDEVADYILNQPPYRDAPVIVANANFGCGSSREQAVWALLGHGIRCVIAPSFGEIFRSNCMRNGVLPVEFSQDVIGQLMAAASAGGDIVIDLEAQTVTADGMEPLAFDIPAERKLALANGWDETDLILTQFGDDIARFEQQQSRSQPWLYEKERAS